MNPSLVSLSHNVLRKSGVAGALSASAITVISENLDSVGYFDWRVYQGALSGSQDEAKIGGVSIVGPTLTNATRQLGPGGPGVTISWNQSGGGSTTQNGRWDATSGASPMYVDFTVPASTTPNKVRILVGTYVQNSLSGRAQAVRFSLSDGSASDVVLTPTQTTDFQRRYTLMEATFNSATNGQTLLIRYENPSPTGVPENYITYLAYGY